MIMAAYVYHVLTVCQTNMDRRALSYKVGDNIIIPILQVRKLRQ